MINKKELRKIFDKAFNFLDDYKIYFVKDKYEKWGYEIRYASTIVGLVVTFEFRDFYPFVKIVRLINEKFPPASGEIMPETVLNSFDLDDIVCLRSSENLLPTINKQVIFNKQLIQKLICQQADNLQTFAGDILNADFSVFSELDKIVKKRAKKAMIDKWGKSEVVVCQSLTNDM